MPIKMFQSEWTWRTYYHQDSVMAHAVPDFHKVTSYFNAEGLLSICRPTKRTTKDEIWVSSIAVLAPDEKSLKDSIRLLNARGCTVRAVEEGIIFGSPIPVAKCVVAWKEARKKGAAKIGGQKSADIRKANSSEAVSKIKDRWPMSSKEWPTKALLREAGISLNTAKAHLGKRPIAQYNYQAKMKRKANAKR